jgi:hypothetical protein
VLVAVFIHRPYQTSNQPVTQDTSSEILTTASFESTVHIKVPADQRISDMAIRSRVVFNDLTGAAKALYALVLAIFVLAGVLGGRSLKRLYATKRGERPRSLAVR